MSARNHVHDAVRRWQRGGLIEDTLADRLRAEADAHAPTEGRRWAQYAVATTGAVILVIAASVFLRWAWPLMGPGSRSVLLAVVGVITMVLGLTLESRARLASAEYLLRAASLAILLMAFGYSRRAWDDASLGAVVFGLGMVDRARRPAAGRCARVTGRRRGRSDRALLRAPIRCARHDHRFVPRTAFGRLVFRH